MIALNPKQTFKFSLEVDEPRAEECRTSFISRFLSAGMLAELDELTNEADVKSGEQERQLLIRAIAIGFVTLQQPAEAVADVVLFLDIEADKPAAERTRFVFRLLTPEEIVEVDRWRDQTAGERIVDVIRKRKEAIDVGLQEVRTPLGEPFDFASCTISELEELLGKIVRISRLAGALDLTNLATPDLWAVALKMIRLSRLTEIERKKSALQSASAAAAKSARTVNLASA
jgi:hypothetical protein